MNIPYYIFAWIASFLFSFEAIGGKLMSRHSISNAWLFNFIWNGFMLVLILLVAPFKHIGLPMDWSSVLLAGVFNAMSGTLFILTLYRIDVSILAPLYTFRTVFAVILGVLLLGEVLTQSQYFLIGLIFLGGIFVNLDEKWQLKSFFSKSIALAMFQMLILAFNGMFINKALGQNGFWEVVMWSNIITQVLLLATIPLFKKDVGSLTKKQLSVGGVIALLGFLGVLASNKAYAENISISSAIISLPISMFLAFLFSVFVPTMLEKHSLKVYMIRFAAAGVMIISALLLT